MYWNEYLMKSIKVNILNHIVGDQYIVFAVLLSCFVTVIFMILYYIYFVPFTSLFGIKAVQLYNDV